jgi:hypothetical protein
MKLFYLSALLIISGILVTSSCKKENNKNEISTDEQGTLEATLGNDRITPCILGPTTNSPITTGYQQVSPTAYTLYATSINSCDNNSVYGHALTVSFDSIMIEVNRTYKLGNFNVISTGQIQCTFFFFPYHYVSDINLPGTITITKFDAVTKRLSASFEGILKDENTGNSINLTQGVFDLKF